VEEEPTEPAQQDSLALPHVDRTTSGGSGGSALPWLLVAILACVAIGLGVGLVATMQATPSEAKLRDQRDAAREQLEDTRHELSKARDALRDAEAVNETPDARDEDAGGDEDAGEQMTEVRRGAVGTDGSLAFRVVEVRPTPSFTTYSGTRRPRSGARFYEVHVEVRNDGTAKADPFCGGTGATMLDEDDREYVQVPDAISLQGNQTCLNGVAPGFKNLERLIFELPASAAPAALVLYDKEDGKDFFGDESSLLVDLG
jgi:hypothetical protein